MSIQITTSLLDFFTEDKLPELEQYIEDGYYKSHFSMIDTLFNTEPMKTDIYQTTTTSGLENPVAKPEATPITYSTMKPGYKKTYTAVNYASGYQVSQEAIDDGKLNLVKKATDSFARGAFEVKEYNMASIFDDGFTVNGYDGVPLFSAAHPIEMGGGAVGSNLGTAAAFSLTSYRALRNILENTVDTSNRKALIKPKYLVIPQALRDEAKKILGSSLEPGSANNDVNTAYGHTTLLPGDFWHYLGSSTAFFMVSDKMDHELTYLPRKAFSVKSEYHFDTSTYKVKAEERYGFGYHNWRGVVGNVGV